MLPKYNFMGYDSFIDRNYLSPIFARVYILKSTTL